MVRILFVHETLGYHGNVEQTIADAARGLADRGHEVSLAYRSESPNKQREFHHLFRRTYRFTDGARPPTPDMGKALARLTSEALPLEPELTASLAEIVAAEKPDVVFVHTALPGCAVEMLPGRPRVVRYVHDLGAVCPKGTNTLTFSRKPCMKPVGASCWFDLAFLSARAGAEGRGGFSLGAIGALRRELSRSRHYDFLLVSSRFMYEQMTVNRIPPEKLAILPPAAVPVSREHCDDPVETDGLGIASLFLGCTDPDDLERYPKDPRILYVGTLVPEKGIDTLFRALKLIVDETEGAGAVLNVVGEGPDESRLRELTVELGLDRYVEFHGWLTHARLGRLYGSAKVVALPSHWPEPYGATGIEAMHRGRPVVAASVGAIPEWLIHGETGYLVPPRNPRLLAGRLSELLFDTEKAWRFGLAGRRRVTEEYSFRDYLDRLEAYLVAGRAGG